MNLSKLIPMVLVGFAACGPDGCCGPAPITPGDDPKPAGSTITVADGKVRSCEASFSVSGTLPSVTFSGAVAGESIPKAPRFAIAFRASEDASLVGKKIADFSSAATLEKSVCYDAAGAVVAGGLEVAE